MDDDSAKLLEVISACTGGLVTGFVVVASFLDSDGDQRIYGNTLDDQRCHTTLGLLSYGLAVETARAKES